MPDVNEELLRLKEWTTAVTFVSVCDGSSKIWDIVGSHSGKKHEGACTICLSQLSNPRSPYIRFSDALCVLTWFFTHTKRLRFHVNIFLLHFSVFMLEVLCHLQKAEANDN